jgi:2-keto-3-deoxy-6-phosphogluconate aldolase
VHHPLWLQKYPVLPIINQATPDEALNIAEALLEGGIDVMESNSPYIPGKESPAVGAKEIS